MGTIPQLRVGAKAEIGSADLPEQVTVALAALAGAVKEGLLALSAASPVSVAVLSQCPIQPCDVDCCAALTPRTGLPKLPS